MTDISISPSHKPAAEAGDHVVLDVDGMSCAGCVSRVEASLKGVAGVRDAQINLALGRADVSMTRPDAVPIERLIEAVESAGYGARKRGDTAGERARAREQALTRARSAFRRDVLILVLSAAATLPLVLPMLAMGFSLDWHLPVYLEAALATFVQIVVGARFYAGAWKALKGRTATMDTLVSIGTSAAWGYSMVLVATQGAGARGHLYFEGAAVILTLVLFGKILEARAKARAGDAIASLASMRPQTALVLGDDGREREIGVADLRAGMHVVVVPGARMPGGRGRRLRGFGSRRGPRHRGERAGSQATRLARGGGIGQRQRAAGGRGRRRRRGHNRCADDPHGRGGAIGKGAGATAGRPDRGGVRAGGSGGRGADVRGVDGHGPRLRAGAGGGRIGSGDRVPLCARPGRAVALVAGTGAAARAGILVRGIEALETFARTDAIVFDKTGTLTVGEPRVTALRPRGVGEADLLRLAASVQQGNQHPLARGIIEAARARGIALSKPESFKAIPGQGVEGIVQGRAVIVGQPGYLRTRAVAMDADEGAGGAGSLVAVAVDGRFAGIIELADAPRRDARAVIDALRGEGLRAIMLTGDAHEVAAALARDLGLDEFEARVTPERKSARIAQLRKEGHVVAMAGDGINDAPALAQADVGIAMGDGTDVAFETADIALMRPELGLVPAAREISRRTISRIRQNLFWAFAFNVVGIPLAALGMLTPALAGAAMAMSSVLVVSNAALLARWRPRPAKV